MSQSQSECDLNSKAARGRREQEGQRTKRRPLTAVSPSSTITEFSPDRESLPRKLPSIPRVDSGALSLNSSTGDLAAVAPECELSPKGASLVQSLLEALKSGEESRKELKSVKADSVALREENRQLRQALGEIHGLSAALLKEYLNTPPSKAMTVLEEVNSKALASKRINSGKRRQPVHNSGTDADAESTSSSSPPTLSKHQHHKGEDGFASDDIVSCKEESSVHTGTHHRGSSEVCPINTD